MDETVEFAKKVKKMADALGKQVFNQLAKVIDALVEKGMDRDWAQSVIEDALTAVMGSFFAHQVSGGDEAASTKIAQDFMSKISALVREEHLKHGARIIEVDLERKEET